jgi:uncharacterized coiled-coil protein SlyX
VRATEVTVVDQSAVEAVNVEAALVALWPTLGRIGALEETGSKQTKAIEELSAQLEALKENQAALAEELAESRSSRRVVEIGIAEVESKLTAANEKLSASNEMLEAALEAKSKELIALQTRTTELEALLGEQATALQAVDDGLDALAISTESDLLALEDKINSPRECPSDMVAISSASCIELTVREPEIHRLAMIRCRLANRRMCSPSEVHAACSQLPVILPEFLIEDYPHWTDSAGRLDNTGADWEHSGFAVGGFGCAFAWEASSTVTAQDTSTALFHFRCCMDRL